MLFVTNRQMLTKGNNIGFELNKNMPTPEVFFCERDDLDVYRELGAKKFMHELSQSHVEHILFYIHGFNNLPEGSVFPVTKALQFLLNRDYDKDKTLVVPVIWPCDNDFGVVKDYWDDQKSADASGISFARALQKFVGWQLETEPCFRSINILAHSMGNRVLREALVHWKYNFSPSGAPMFFRNIFMAAADVVDETLEKGQRGNVITEMAKNVVVYYAGDDQALRGSKVSNTLGHRFVSRRLGHKGPENMDRVPKNVKRYDCDRYNTRYDPKIGHTYFLGNEDGILEPGKVCLHLKQCVETGKVRPLSS